MRLACQFLFTPSSDYKSWQAKEKRKYAKACLTFSCCHNHLLLPWPTIQIFESIGRNTATPPCHSCSIFISFSPLSGWFHWTYYLLTFSCLTSFYGLDQLNLMKWQFSCRPERAKFVLSNFCLEMCHANQIKCTYYIFSSK